MFASDLIGEILHTVCECCLVALECTVAPISSGVEILALGPRDTERSKSIEEQEVLRTVLRAAILCTVQ